MNNSGYLFSGKKRKELKKKLRNLKMQKSRMWHEIDVDRTMGFDPHDDEHWKRFEKELDAQILGLEITLKVKKPLNNI